MIDPRLIKIAAYVSLAICIASVLAIVLHLGPLEDKLKSRYVAVDGNVWLYIECDQLGMRHVGVVAIPLQIVAPLAAVLPICLAVSNRLQRQRVTPGLCLSCGYDLRGSPDRCPECGRAVERAEVLQPRQIGIDEKRTVLRRLKADQKDH